MARKASDWLDDALVRRQAGMTLEAIGQELGLTRERIRQGLKRYVGTANSAELGNPEERGFARHDSEVFADIVRPYTIRKWERQGHVASERFGAVTYYSVEDVLEYFMAQMQRPCQGPKCNRTIDSLIPHQRYCAACSKERQRYDYPFKNAEQKARAKAAAEAWKERNPEAAQAIKARAGRQWRQKKKREALEALEREAAEPGFVGYLNTPEGRKRFPEGRLPGKMAE